MVGLMVGAADGDAGDKNPLSETLYHQLFQQLDSRHHRLLQYKHNTTAWKERQERVRGSLASLFGPYREPSLPPPPFQITGELHHASGFSVKKLLFQSRPGLFVSAALWVPDGANTTRCRG